MDKSFKGKLVRIGLHYNDGHSVGTLLQGYKNGDSPKGMHVHGGNGTFVDYGNAEYISVDHKIAAVFAVPCTYFDPMEGGKVTKVSNKEVILADFNHKRTDKQETILSLIADIVNGIFGAVLGVAEYEFPLEHIKNEKENKWLLMKPFDAALPAMVVDIYKRLSENADKSNVSEKEIIESKSEICKEYVKFYSEAVKKMLSEGQK